MLKATSLCLVITEKIRANKAGVLTCSSVRALCNLAICSSTAQCGLGGHKTMVQFNPPPKSYFQLFWAEESELGHLFSSVTRALSTQRKSQWATVKIFPSETTAWTAWSFVAWIVAVGAAEVTASHGSSCTTCTLSCPKAVITKGFGSTRYKWGVCLLQFWGLGWVELF